MLCSQNYCTTNSTNFKWSGKTFFSLLSYVVSANVLMDWFVFFWVQFCSDLWTAANVYWLRFKTLRWNEFPLTEYCCTIQFKMKSKNRIYVMCGDSEGSVCFYWNLPDTEIFLKNNIFRKGMVLLYNFLSDSIFILQFYVILCFQTKKESCLGSYFALRIQAYFI